MDRTLKVERIELAAVRRLNKQQQEEWINVITFRQADGSNYIAEEPSSMHGISQFKEQEMNTFKVIAAGRDNRRDWVQFLGVGVNVVHNREKLLVAQNCVLKAHEMAVKDRHLLFEKKFHQATEEEREKMLYDLESKTEIGDIMDNAHRMAQQAFNLCEML